jgi:hypothetical protein
VKTLETSTAGALIISRGRLYDKVGLTDGDLARHDSGSQHRGLACINTACKSAQTQPRAPNTLAPSDGTEFCRPSSCTSAPLPSQRSPKVPVLGRACPKPASSYAERAGAGPGVTPPPGVPSQTLDCRRPASAVRVPERASSGDKAMIPGLYRSRTLTTLLLGSRVGGRRANGHRNRFFYESQPWGQGWESFLWGCGSQAFSGSGAPCCDPQRATEARREPLSHLAIRQACRARLNSSFPGPLGSFVGPLCPGDSDV